MTQEIAFDGELLAARGGGHAIAVDEARVTSLGAKHMSRVAGTLNGHPFRSNVVKMGGAFFLGVHKANVDALGLRSATPSRSSCRSTTEPRGDDTPPDDPRGGAAEGPGRGGDVGERWPRRTGESSSATSRRRRGTRPAHVA